MSTPAFFDRGFKYLVQYRHRNLLPRTITNVARISSNKRETVNSEPNFSAEEILRKYESHPLIANSDKLLPTHTNQQVNEYLKTITENCEINKKLTFHVARHTLQQQ